MSHYHFTISYHYQYHHTWELSLSCLQQHVTVFVMVITMTHGHHYHVRIQLSFSFIIIIISGRYYYHFFLSDHNIMYLLRHRFRYDVENDPPFLRMLEDGCPQAKRTATPPGMSCWVSPSQRGPIRRRYPFPSRFLHSPQNPSPPTPLGHAVGGGGGNYT